MTSLHLANIDPENILGVIKSNETRPSPCETKAHLTAGGVSSWARDTGLGAQRHNTTRGPPTVKIHTVADTY